MPKYSIGDYVIYGVNGACEIVEIGPLSFGGADKDYYSMKPVSDARSTIYMPVHKEDEIKRLVMSKEDAEQLVEDIKKAKPLKVNSTKDNLESIIKSGDALKVSRLVKMLRILRNENRKIHKGLNIQEEKLLRQSEIVVYSELSISLENSMEEIIEKYSEIFD